MDLVDEILRFSSVLQRQEESPLKDGLTFYRVEEALTPPDYDDIESVTTVDGIGGAVTYKPTSRRESKSEADPGTPSSQATVTTKISIEGWPAQRTEMELELERLSMWKYDVLHQDVDAMFMESNPLHSMMQRSLVNIGHTMLGLLKPELTAPDTRLVEAYKSLYDKTEDHRKYIDSRSTDEESRLYHRTRSRQNSTGVSSDDEDILNVLHDNIDRLGYVTSGVLVMNTATSLGKRARSEHSSDEGYDKVERKKPYNGWFNFRVINFAPPGRQSDPD
ncbi:hypothetical protein VPNG_01410 [Cytospora leucostoma]|uniref:Uncharacterized protein n=1 Tax=Cytospora leucostoma TaxID=1230097 RepID=A0A423XL52_9PEZI|nr:hypothetical protein VPNG_01410 [Cytospora leucostoma]